MENENNVEIPIGLKIENLKQNITNLINDSKLPIYILNPILKNFYQESELLLNNYIKIEINDYKKNLENVDINVNVNDNNK